MKIHKISTLAVSAAIAMSSLAIRAEDVYVRANAAAGGNGSEASPFSTIQDAVDAASAGDVIHVAAGTYATGGAVDGFNRSSTVYSMSNRVYITKSLTICGAGMDKTFIVGSHASAAEDSAGLGLGADAVRCIGINANNVVVSNLTITGGATKVPASSDDCNGNGGGVYVQNGKTGVYIVDCVISNNIAQRGAGMRYDNDSTFNAAAVRCWFHANKAVNRDPATRGVLLVHCLVTHHTYNSSLAYSGKFVNCTFADNYCRVVCDASASAYNCLFADYWYKADTGSYDTCAFPIEENMVTVATEGKCMYSVGYDHFIAPLKGDYRLHDEATVLNAGAMSYLAALDIPSQYKDADFYGNAINTAAATLHLGCCQQPVTPVGGTVRFASIPSAATPVTSYSYSLTSNNRFLFDGMGEPMICGDLAYVRAAEWPVSVKVAAETVAWAGLYGFAASGADTVSRYPYLDGTYEIFAPKSAAAELTLTPQKADSVVYVRQSPAAASPAGTAEAPDTDLQTAIGRVGSNKYGVIYCLGENTFANGNVKYNASIISNRVGVTGKNVRIVGVGGPKKNVIVGAPDSTVALDAYPYGMGPGAIRCVYLAGTSAIQGFTLTGGYSDSASASDNRAMRGSGAFINAAGAQITDCVISNCVGAQGVAICGQDAKTSNGYAFRCLILDNRQWSTSGTEAGGGIVRMANGGSLLMAGNNGIVSGSYEGQQLYNCSIFSSAGESGTALNVLSTVTTNYNCAIKLTGGANGKLNNTVVHGGVVSFTGGAVHSSSTSWTKSNPLFADASSGDLRLAAVSPARTYGTFDGPNARYHVFMGRDFYGNPYRVENGKPLCGAVHDFAPTLVASGSGISPSGATVFRQSGATVEFTATSERPLVGFLVNGETQEVAGVTYTYTVPAADDYSTPFEVSALYGTDWYVDAGAASDDGNGNAANPKRTLAGALVHAVSGDVVHVAPGTYAEGSMTQNAKAFAVTTNYVVNCRACIPEGVSVVSQGSAADTFIVGEDAPAAAIVTNGCGKGATRCVFMNYNSSLRGFTVTGGRTDAVTGDSSDNTAAGGVLARNDTAVVSDCIISNNVAQRGGGVYFGTYDRCRFLGNTVVNSGNGSAVHGENGAVNNPFTIKMRNCIVAGNAGYVTVYYGLLDNCTLAADNVDHNGNANQMTLLNVCPGVRNTLILGFKATTGAIGLYNCAFTAETAAQLAKNTSAATNACLVASSDAELQVDGFAPIPGSNIAVDAGDASLYDAAVFGDKDVFGNPRAVNGARMDIGAVEATWLGEYTAALGSRFVSVTAASPEVELTAAGVSIPDGASLRAAVYGAGKPRVFTLSVASGGTCEAECDGEPLASFSAGDGQALRVEPSGEVAELALSSYGAATVVSSVKSGFGTLLIVR